MTKILKRFSHAIATGLLVASLVMAPVALTGCNPTAEVNLVASLAVNLLNSCAGFGLNPVDSAACAVGAGAVQAADSAFITCYNAYEGVKGASGTTLQAFEACAQSELTNIGKTLAAFKISNSTVQGYIVTAINLIISTIEIILSFFGIATPAQISHASVAFPGTGSIHKEMSSIGKWNTARKAKDAIRTKWNSQICIHVTAPAVCTVK